MLCRIDQCCHHIIGRHTGGLSTSFLHHDWMCARIFSSSLGCGLIRHASVTPPPPPLDSEERHILSEVQQAPVPLPPPLPLRSSGDQHRTSVPLPTPPSSHAADRQPLGQARQVSVPLPPPPLLHSVARRPLEEVGHGSNSLPPPPPLLQSTDQRPLAEVRHASDQFPPPPVQSVVQQPVGEVHQASAPVPPPPLRSVQRQPSNEVHQASFPPLPPPPPPSPMQAQRPASEARASIEVQPSLSLQPPLRGLPESDELGPDDILVEMGRQGPWTVLSRFWDRIEHLQQKEFFTCAHIASMFDMCSVKRASEIGRRRQTANGDTVAPIRNRFVQLFSNFVCERIIELTPAQITTFITSLTSANLPQDEFWLFMLAKRVQDTPQSFSAEQLVIIADRYAEKNLEDDEFFMALAANVVSRLSEFNSHQLSSFLYSCSRLRFSDDDVCNACLVRFQNPCDVGKMAADALGMALTACSTLDLRCFSALPCYKRLAENPTLLRALVAKSDITMGVMLSAVYLGSPRNMRFLLPPLLQEISGSRYLFQYNGPPGEISLVYRRVTVLALCAVLGLPCSEAWSLTMVKRVNDLHGQLLTRMQERRLLRTFEPSSSSFHLEVVAVLQFIDVEHQLEHPQHPFHLDVLILPAQLEDGMRKWKSSAHKPITDGWPPTSTGPEGAWPPLPNYSRYRYDTTPGMGQ